MADVTYYVALPFIVADDGIAPGEAAECQSSHAAIRKAEQLSRVAGNVGAVAFSRTGDPGSGEFADALVLKAFGDVLSDLARCDGCQHRTGQHEQDGCWPGWDEAMVIRPT
jgi:hypothetical protein